MNMKKLLLLSTFLVFAIICVGQTRTDSISPSPSSTTYCEIVGTQGLFSSKITVEIDYGQDKGGFFDRADSRLKDENGKLKKFNSMIDVLNVMSSEGWDFVNAYAIGDKQSGYVYHWLMKRKSK
jgi:hypothetical protein